MSLIPRYPNLSQAIGSTLPIVTSLLAATSTALLVVPLTSTAPGKCLRFANWSSDKGGVVFGSLAVGLFVAATLALVYTQVQLDSAASVLPDSSKTAYEFARFFWINGVSALALTLGCIAFDKLPWELPVMATISFAVSFANVLSKDVPGPGRALSWLVSSGSLYIAVATPLHPFC
jgi:hypothetical protein